MDFDILLLSTELLDQPHTKVGCVFPMIISSEFHIGQYGDNDFRERASNFSLGLVLVLG